MDKVVFLDRDGVINRDIEGGYVTSWAKFEFLPNVFEALRRLKEYGFRVVIISNQAGVGRGLYTEESLAQITLKMVERVKKEGGNIDDVFYCIHRPDEGCFCRKPNPGLIKQASLGRNYDLARAFMVGDSEKDIAAAKAAGVNSILVLSGKAQVESDADFFGIKPDFIAEDLLDAVENVIIKQAG